MTTAEFVSRVARRRKLVAGIVAGALAATVGLVAFAYWWSRIRNDRPLRVPVNLPTNIHQQLSGYSFTRSDEGRQIFTVHAARSVAFKQGGTTVLEDVYVEFFGRTGDRRDVLRTRRCNYNAQSGDLSSSDKVEIEFNAQTGSLPRAGRRGRQPVSLETSQVSFRQQGSLVVSDAPVRFRIGPAFGSARGMTYATTDGWMELRKDIVLELPLPGRAESEPPVQLSASRLRYEKESGELRFSGPVEIAQGSRRVVSDRAMLFLDEFNRITRAGLEGRVRASYPGGVGLLEGSAERVHGDFDPASGQLRNVEAEGNVVLESRRPGNFERLRAEQFQVSFSGVNPQPRSARAMQNVELTLESTPAASKSESAAGSFPPERKILTGGEVQVAFRPGIQTLKEAQTVGPGKLVVVPPDPKVGERVITADQFLMDFDPRGRLHTLRGLNRTRIVFQPPVNAPPGILSQETSAERLEAAFEPGTQTLRTVEQTGDFRFREGERQASAERAQFSSPTQVLTLTGNSQVWDAHTRTAAQRILFDLRGDTAEGVGKVQSTHFGGSGQSTGRPPTEPTHVLADRMLVHQHSQFVHYEGHVRAWQGTDVVESSSLDVDGRARRVTSASRVLASHLQPASLMQGSEARGAPKREPRPLTIRADRLEYFDQGRKASYRGNVQLETQNTTLRADRVDVYFSAEDAAETSEVERAVAEGLVTIVQPARRATGDHAEYIAASGKIVLTGGPPTLYDTAKGLTTGQRLTFTLHDDTVRVDGGDGSPTISRHRIAQ